MTSKGARLKALIDAPEILITPGVYDGFSARLIERAGFKTGTITGAGVSESKLGWADRGVMGFDANLDNARRLADCCDLLLQADADTGYGNALNVYFVVQAFEKAGMAAIMIEDQVWPKRCGHMPGKTVIPAEEMVQKVKAAVDARRDQNFVVKARTDAAAPLGIEEAIRRLNLYAEAGADILLADAITTREDIARVAKEVNKPVSMAQGLGIRTRKTTPPVPPGDLQSLGVAQVTYPRLLTAASLKGMQNALVVFQEELIGRNHFVDRPDLLASFDEINDLMGLPFLEEIESRYAS